MMSAKLFDQLQNFRRRGVTSSASASESASNLRMMRPPIDPETSKVKRALFGPVDHDENLRFVQRELQKNVQEQVSC
jgi:hypothetical protein